MSTHPKALELAAEETWFKSTYSGDDGSSCVEIANLTPTHPLIAVRDSKLPHGPALALPPQSFAAFVDHVRQRGTGASA
ncbi:DUF397 domain-containing protein [Streptomyces sp. S.PB5]|uniref:DUF397 domain-containing protein n=1 Tax=Streptomyces sp. S.PB5 TaxID=3020844 RepID=UPI0025AF50BB|nr:DUF397 domain-containing protein [Streptomyces sp. S.PB5]MDN3023900.1 DUF397 domain-containing protein [Streptomyces sp. S.PB5]